VLPTLGGATGQVIQILYMSQLFSTPLSMQEQE
jgi:hypothetical protein